MTTTVTVRADSGFPVKVIQISVDNDGHPVSTNSHPHTVVLPGHNSVFYVHSHQELIIKELPAIRPPA